MDGHVRHQVRVSRNEVTCLVCGEVWAAGLWGGCPRCSSEVGKMKMTPTVPTVAYLRENEYELV